MKNTEQKCYNVQDKIKMTQSWASFFCENEQKGQKEKLEKKLRNQQKKLKNQQKKLKIPTEETEESNRRCEEMEKKKKRKRCSGAMVVFLSAGDVTWSNTPKFVL